MPKYSFKCKDCSNHFEVNASIKEMEQKKNKYKCPVCKNTNTKEVFSFKSFFSKDEDCCGGGCCSN